MLSRMDIAVIEITSFVVNDEEKKRIQDCYGIQAVAGIMLQFKNILLL